MTNRNFKVIDMKCGNCNKEFPMSKELKEKHIVRNARTGRLFFSDSIDSLEENQIPCPACEHPNPKWYEGENASEANEVDTGNINIKGNVTGTNFVIGDNNNV